ncbi:phage baseplate assembly protein domain-containing protein [Escherichia coli]|uniref:phage baseplate assembly protein domain-containing protein n=1 Tax=Escherichia coli TaxID=562 RepID=UPI002FCCF09D
MVSDSLERQNLQIQTLADATDDDVERFQNYGLLPFRRKVLKPLCWPWRTA